MDRKEQQCYFYGKKKKKSSKLLSGRKRLVSTLVSVEVVWVGGPCCRGGWSELLKPGWASFVRNMRESYLVSSPITLWEIDGETAETVSDFIFLGSKITTDGDCNHEIKRRLLLGRKVMINLDSIFKSRDITLPTKFRLVKAMVFPVVMYGCETWTVKKAER